MNIEYSYLKGCRVTQAHYHLTQAHYHLTSGETSSTDINVARDVARDVAREVVTCT